MHITRIIFTFLAALLCGMAQAQDETVVLQVELNNGDVVEGTMYTGILNCPFYLNGSAEVAVKDKESGKKTTFASTEVKEVRVYNEEESTWVKWLPLMAERNVPAPWRKKPRLNRSPVFLHPLYEGKHVSAYVQYINRSMDITGPMRPTGVALKAKISRLFYFFKLNDEDIAKAYADVLDDHLDAMIESILKYAFADYPDMNEVIENFDKEAFCEDPTSIIKKFDAVLDESSFKAE